MDFPWFWTDFTVENVEESTTTMDVYLFDMFF